MPRVNLIFNHEVARIDQIVNSIVIGYYTRVQLLGKYLGNVGIDLHNV